MVCVYQKTRVTVHVCTCVENDKFGGTYVNMRLLEKPL